MFPKSRKYCSLWEKWRDYLRRIASIGIREKYYDRPRRHQYIRSVQSGITHFIFVILTKMTKMNSEWRTICFFAQRRGSDNLSDPLLYSTPSARISRNCAPHVPPVPCHCPGRHYPSSSAWRRYYSFKARTNSLHILNGNPGNFSSNCSCSLQIP